MRLLLGADGSSYAMLAEELVLRIPEFASAEITVASVAAGEVESFARVGATVAEEALRVHKSGVQAAHDYADAAVTRLRGKGANASAAYLEGDPKNELLEFAERNAMDAIAIGSRGLGGFQSILLGSVARRLVSRAPCEVLVARSFGDESPERSLERVRQGGKLSVTVGADGSNGAQVALDFLKSQGLAVFEKVAVVCAEPLSVVPSGIDPAGLASLYQYDHERATQVAERSAIELQTCAEEVVSGTGLGRPANVIADHARQTRSDLVVVGANQHGVIERFLIGSVSYELVTEAPCSVLVVRPLKE